MTVSTIDLSIIAVYILATTVFGAWFVRKSQNLDGFTLAGNSIPGWAIGISLLATYLSSISFLANPGKTYAANWSPFVFSLTLPIAIYFAVRYFIPLYRQKVKTTAYEFLEQRFGLWARAYMGVTYIMLQIGRFAVVLYLIALALGSLLQISIPALIIVLGLLTLVYTLLGGFAAVIWTDVVQSVVLLFAGLACLVLILVDLPAGWGTLFTVASDQNKFSLGSLDFNLMIQGFWVIFLFGIVENLKNFSVDQNYVQRFLAAPSEQQAVKSLWLGGLLYIPVSALFFLIGTALFVYYLQFPTEALPAKADQVFPFFIVNQLPVGFVGLVIAGVMAAGMSTLDSSLNSSSTVWTIDFYKRLINKDADDKQQLQTIRLTTIVIGLIATGCSLIMIDAKSALDVWWKISAIFGGGMLGLFLIAILLPNLSNRQAQIATLIGIVFVAWGTGSSMLIPEGEAWRFPLHTMMIGVFGTLIMVISGYLMGLFSGKRG